MSDRIQKPLTAAQRANIAKQRKTPYLIGPIRTSGIPPVSWWATAPRVGWGSIAAGQLPRMAQSRFARVLDPTYGS